MTSFELTAKAVFINLNREEQADCQNVAQFSCHAEQVRGWEASESQQPSRSTTDEEGKAPSHSIVVRWMAYLKVHCLRGFPEMIDGHPQQLNFRAFKCHSRMECHLIKVLFNIYQMWMGWGGGCGVILWGDRENCYSF